MGGVRLIGRAAGGRERVRWREQDYRRISLLRHTCVSEFASANITPSRQYDASASGEERELTMTLRTAVRNGEASDALAECVRIFSRSECNPAVPMMVNSGGC